MVVVERDAVLLPLLIFDASKCPCKHTLSNHAGCFFFESQLGALKQACMYVVKVNRSKAVQSVFNGNMKV